MPAFFVIDAGQRTNSFVLVGFEQTETCRFATVEFGEKVLNERSEFRNLTLNPGPATNEIKPFN